MAKTIKGGSVTSPLGFLASGVHSGIKKKKTDLALIFSSGKAVAAGCFTRNTVKAWPVLHSKEAIRHRRHRAIVANSGNANCLNGQSGKRAVRELVEALARELKVKPKEVLVASTGIIGRGFPTRKALAAIPELVGQLSRESGWRAAEAVMTTDTHSKQYALSFHLDGKEVRIGAIAKGAGMVNPSMATMLSFLTTDCAITKAMLAQALRESVCETFNRISIDTDMSTNDTVFILANGMAQNPEINRRGRLFRSFLAHLKKVCRAMARALVKDAEGATRTCEIKIRGAKTDLQADRVVRQIASSMLFKTMLAGSEPNWGRVLAAMGATQIPVDLSKVDLSFDGVKVFQQGKIFKKNLPLVRKILGRREMSLVLNLGMGSGSAQMLTCDLTRDYVRLNSWYTT